MPIIDLGYRAWDGERSNRATRWLTVTATGIRLVWRAVWLRRLLYLSLLPMFPAGFAIFFYEQSHESPGVRRGFVELAGEFEGSQAELAKALTDDSAESRHTVWSNVLLTYFRYPQAMLMVVLFGLVAPRLISYDIRSRAYLLYFSRPLSVFEYLLGKAMVLMALLACTSTVPALGLYVLALALSPDPLTVLDTWDLPLRIIAASVTLAIPTAALAIFYSSFTSESRYAAFAWFATWGLGWVVYLVLTSNELILSQGTALPRYLNLVSPYHVLGQVQALVFGVTGETVESDGAVMLVSVVTVCSIAVAYQRIAGQLRI